MLDAEAFGSALGYKLAAEFILAYEEANVELREKQSASPEGPERAKLQRAIQTHDTVFSDLIPLYGPRSERTKDLLVRDIEEIGGQTLDREKSSDDQ